MFTSSSMASVTRFALARPALRARRGERIGAPGKLLATSNWHM
jgi:hypothetical protein